MKKIIFITLISFFVFSFSNKKDVYFEGMISYKHTYISLNPSVSNAYYEKVFGTGSEFYFKDGNYVQYFNGKKLKLNIWFWEAGKSYMRYDSDTLFCMDTQVGEADKITKIIIEDSIFNIGGYECKKLATKTTNSQIGDKSVDFYYSEKIKINPIWFEKVKFDADNIRYKKIKSIPLKTVIANKDLIVIMEAIEVKNMDVPKSYFTIEGYKLKGCD